MVSKNVNIKMLKTVILPFALYEYEIGSWSTSDSIVSDYRLDDPGSIPGKGFFSIACVSRPAMRPTQPPILSRW
jgi:hypothetical protein